MDWPGCAFYEPLMEVFPQAKVLLTVRDPDAWYESVESSIYASLTAGLKRELAGGTATPPSPETFGMISMLIWEGTFDGRFEDRDYAIEVFNRHNEQVMRKVPAERLVVHEVKDGWRPLAEMLGVAEPDAPFPRLNDRAAFRAMIGLPALEDRDGEPAMSMVEG